MDYVTSQAFTLDDVHYSIGVYRSDDGFLAFCDCHKCHAHNMKSTPCADKKAAIRECEDLIRQHHTERHPTAF
jgi:hypothetical protein